MTQTAGSAPPIDWTQQRSVLDDVFSGDFLRCLNPIRRCVAGSTVASLGDLIGPKADAIWSGFITVDPQVARARLGFACGGLRCVSVVVATVA
jgi:hypothetical protein